MDLEDVYTALKVTVYALSTALVSVCILITFYCNTGAYNKRFILYLPITKVRGRTVIDCPCCEIRTAV